MQMRRPLPVEFLVARPVLTRSLQAAWDRWGPSSSKQVPSETEKVEGSIELSGAILLECDRSVDTPKTVMESAKIVRTRADDSCEMES